MTTPAAFPPGATPSGVPAPGAAAAAVGGAGVPVASSAPGLAQPLSQAAGPGGPARQLGSVPGFGRSAQPTRPQRLPLLRPPRPNRWLTGVASGLAAHLDVPPVAIRLGFVAATLVSGLGLLLYVMLWALVPAGDPWAPTPEPARARLAARLTVPGTAGNSGSNPGNPVTSTSSTGQRSRAMFGSLILAAAAIMLALSGWGPLTELTWLVPMVLVCAGAALAWSQVEPISTGSRDAADLIRFALGVLMTALGILLAVGAWLGVDVSPVAAVKLLIMGCAMAAGVTLMVAPLWLRVMRVTTSARQAEAREAERADIAAHLHDSVLQTLTLIRKRAQDPAEVARLARAQERDLRAWLYTDRSDEATSVAQSLRETVALTEDRFATEVDAVIVGDADPTPDSEALLAATREALANAMKHGAPPVSLYAEFAPTCLEIFVRDHGPGFSLEDLKHVPDDRHGVRQSILQRLASHHGEATWRALEHGTEVHLRLDLTAPAAPTTASA